MHGVCTCMCLCVSNFVGATVVNFKREKESHIMLCIRSLHSVVVFPGENIHTHVVLDLPVL